MKREGKREGNVRSFRWSNWRSSVIERSQDVWRVAVGLGAAEWVILRSKVEMLTHSATGWREAAEMRKVARNAHALRYGSGIGAPSSTDRMRRDSVEDTSARDRIRGLQCE